MTDAKVIPFRLAGAEPLSPNVAWMSSSRQTHCTVSVDPSHRAPASDRAELVAHLRALADLVEGPAGGAFFGGVT